MVRDLSERFVCPTHPATKHADDPPVVPSAHSTMRDNPIPANTDGARTRSFDGYRCRVDCGGHRAGYRWVEKNDIDDEDLCKAATRSIPTRLQSVRGVKLSLTDYPTTELRDRSHSSYYVNVSGGK